MSTATLTSEFTATTSVLSGILDRRKAPGGNGILSVQIDVPDFGCSFVVPLVDIDTDWEAGIVVLRSALEPGAGLLFRLSGEVLAPGEPFTIKQVTLAVEKANCAVRSDFILSSLWAMFALSERVHLSVPELGLNLSFGFDKPLLEVAEMLRRRQTDYRVMLIESATGLSFDLPPNITGDEMGEIALVYNAIVERSFDWPIEKVTASFPATSESLERLQGAEKLDSFMIGPDPVLKTLFGKQVYLGEGTLTLFDTSIENFGAVVQELGKKDGREVVVSVHSAVGYGRYSLPQAPILPITLWDETIRSLIGAEETLDTKLIERYHNLAAATLNGLEVAERVAITERPDLDDETFG